MLWFEQRNVTCAVQYNVLIVRTEEHVVEGAL